MPRRALTKFLTQYTASVLEKPSCGCDTRDEPDETGEHAANGHAADTLANAPIGQPDDPSGGEPTATPHERWAGPIGVENRVVGGLPARMWRTGAIRWGEQPGVLRFVAEDNGGHDGAVDVGRIETIERRDNGILWGEGTVDVSIPEGAEAYRQIESGLKTGVSADLDEVSFEVWVAKDALDSMEDGGEVDVPTPDADGRVKVMEVHAQDEVMVTTDALIRGATLVSIPAFVEARIEAVEATPEQIAASGAVVQFPPKPGRPPKEWFTDPHLDGPTPLVVTDEGRVYGHLACWGTCHTSYVMQGKCVLAPRSSTGYQGFHTGSAVTAEGESIPVGRITFTADHANRYLSAAATVAHYENTGTLAATVRAGEDQYGVWVAGATIPGLSEAQLVALRASPISGDWREIGTGPEPELVAALAVNVAGFPIPRPAGLVAAGRVRSLVAAGVLTPEPGVLAHEDVEVLRRLAARERRRHVAVLEGFAARVRVSRASMLAKRVHG